MTYKNGVKEYVLTGVLFGVPMGLLFGLIHFDWLLGVISGVFSGVLYALLILIFLKRQEKKYNKKRLELAQERRIICDGAATVSGNGGWMFLTEYGLEFYPHKLNLSTQEVLIPISTIQSVSINKNQIVINANGIVFPILVTHNKEWKKQIEDVLLFRSESM